MDCFSLLKTRFGAVVTPAFSIAVLVILFTTDSVATAGGRRFTFVYEAGTMPQGEVEYEQWITWKTDKDSDSDFDRIDFRHEIEIGITDRFQLAFYLSDWRYENGASVDDGAEWRNAAIEVIYNLADPATESFGLALYGEIKLGDEKVELEGKIIVQKNIGKWVFAYNATVEAEWEGSDFSEDKGEFQQTLGGNYQFSPKIFAGFELLHEIEYDDWDTWGDHILYAGPNVSYHSDQWWVTLTPLVQITDVEDEANFLLRLIFGIDF